MVLWNAVFNAAPPGIAAVDVFDIGQGDGIFIEAENGNHILIDGGPDAQILEKVAGKLGFFDRSIDLVVLTHPDRDHLAGLLSVLDRYAVKAVLATGARRETADFHLWEEKLRARHVPVTIVKAGLWADVASGMRLLAFAPERDVSGATLEKTNNTGIVLKLIYGHTSYLFTADIEEPVEDSLLRSRLNLDADVLKVAHHGSKTSSSENFLDAVSPRMAVISVGRRNTYGHPHRVVLGRLRERGIKLFRTDLDGDVEFVSDGQKVWRSP